MQDEAPAHYTNAVTMHLSKISSQNWNAHDDHYFSRSPSRFIFKSTSQTEGLFNIDR